MIKSQKLIYLSSMILQNVSTVIVPIIRLLPHANSLQNQKKNLLSTSDKNKISTYRLSRAILEHTHGMVHQDRAESTMFSYMEDVGKTLGIEIFIHYSPQNTETCTSKKHLQLVQYLVIRISISNQNKLCVQAAEEMRTQEKKKFKCKCLQTIQNHHKLQNAIKQNTY